MTTTSKPRRDIAQEITDKIVAMIETGGDLPWRQPWRTASGSAHQLRHNGERYQGINQLLTTFAAMAGGYASPFWMTFKQALDLGGNVRKGERGTMVVYYGSVTREEETASGDTEERSIRFLKSYTVFNADQCDGLPERFHPAAGSLDAGGRSLPEMDAWFARLGGTVQIGGNSACYLPSLDQINMPPVERFEDTEKFYSTLAHEYVHWTATAARCDRDFGSTGFGSEGYAREELVAELGAAFIGAELGLAPYHIEDHAGYLAAWLRCLKSDKRAILKHAADAQRAADYLCGLASEQATTASAAA